MRVLFAGKDEFTYNRTQILIAGLKKRSDIEFELFSFRSRRGFDKKNWQEKEAWADCIYIPPLRHGDVFFIRKHTKKPIIFDPLISKYLTRTKDHGKWWTAAEKKWRDRIAVNNCDYLLMDTQAHLDFMVNEYHFNSSKTGIVPIGADIQKFHPQPYLTDSKKFKVGFYGGFVPLQGIDRIVQAAKILKDQEDINFEIIGFGPFYPKIRKLAQGLSNIDFTGWVDYDLLNEKINQFDLTLGVFGTSLKTNLVIPNKIFHYAALKKCIITKDTPGIREAFQDRKNIVLTSNDPEQIASHIMEMKKDKKARNEIGEAGYDLVVKEFNEDKVAEAFTKVVARATSQ